MSLWRKYLDAGFSPDVEGLVKAEAAWAEWVKANQDVILDDLEEDMSPRLRYHYVIYPGAAVDEVKVVINGVEYFIGDDF